MNKSKDLMSNSFCKVRFKVTLENDIHNVIGVSRITEIELDSDSVLEDDKESEYGESFAKKLYNEACTQEFIDEDENYVDEIKQYLHEISKRLGHPELSKECFEIIKR